MKTQSGRAKKSGRGRGGGGQGTAAVSRVIAGDLEEAGAGEHAAVALGAEMAELLLAPGAGNVAAQGIRKAESLFLVKFQPVDSDAPSPAAATGPRSRGDRARATGDGHDDVGGVVAGATNVVDMCKNVKEDKASVTIAELKRKLAAEAAEAERKLVALADEAQCTRAGVAVLRRILLQQDVSEPDLDCVEQKAGHHAVAGQEVRRDSRAHGADGNRAAGK